jgi:hypothetical protein
MSGTLWHPVATREGRGRREMIVAFDEVVADRLRERLRDPG